MRKNVPFCLNWVRPQSWKDREIHRSLPPSLLSSPHCQSMASVTTVSSTAKFGGIKSVRFLSKIKRQNQERFSVIYTESATITKFHRTAGFAPSTLKTTQLASSQVASWPYSNGLFQKKTKRGGERGRRYGTFKGIKEIAKGIYKGDQE